MNKESKKLTLKIEDLQVQSFITVLSEDEKKYLHAGDFNCPNQGTGSGASATYCYTGICVCGG